MLAKWYFLYSKNDILIFETIFWLIFQLIFDYFISGEIDSVSEVAFSHLVLNSQVLRHNLFNLHYLIKSHT